MDLNVRAFRTVQEALNKEDVLPDKRKESSRKGGLIGGKARAKTLTRARKREIALAGSSARWSPKKSAEAKRAEEAR